MQNKMSKTPLQRALGESRKIFIIVGLFSLVVNILMLTGPLYMLQVYDRVLTSSSFDTLIALTILAAGLLFTQAVLEFVRSRILARLTTRLDDAVSIPLMQSTVTHNLGKPNSSAAASLRDLDTFKAFLSGPALIAFFDAPWTPLFLAVIFLMHPLLGIVALCGGLMLFIITAIGEMLTRRRFNEATAHAQNSYQFADTSLANAEVIEAMGMMGNIVKRWDQHNRAKLKHFGLANERAATLTAIAKFLRPALQVSMLGVGAWLAIRHEITPGVMIASSIIMARALAPVEALISQWRNVVSARGTYARLNALLKDTADQPASIALPRPKGHLSVENLIAAPPGHNKATIQNISFAVAAGEVLGVIGASGAGKTTLARLLSGAWKPLAGQVRIDSANVAKWRAEDRGPYIGYLPQGVDLFDGTVADNIARLGTPDSEKVLAAALLSGAHEMILRLPEGYETHIGPRGSVLSAGQRQRVALARALYGDPPFIVLDEPNANLDQEGEQSLRAAILSLKQRGSTVVIIAHHSNILSVCDKLLVLQNGRAESFGPREKVLAQLTRPAEGTAARIRAVETT